MKTFYLYRTVDIHGNSGIGLVAEGTIFDNGMVSMTWLSEHPTVTIFKNITTVEKLHGHEGLTKLVIEGNRKNFIPFSNCKKMAREWATKEKLRKEQEQQ
jgi:hypothetical protein